MEFQWKDIVILYCTVFLCGAVVMVFEIAGSRVLSPYFGSSTVVWTAMIGVIMGSLSAGYYVGGKMADRMPRLSVLAYIVFLVAIFLGVTIIIKDIFLALISSLYGNSTTGLLVGCVVLFAPASVLLGMVSPYAVRLRLQSTATGGSAAGSLYAVSTLGSIVGTFLAGFVLIPRIGTHQIMIILFLVTVGVSFCCHCANGSRVL